MTVHWPREHRARYEAEARKLRMPLGHYLILKMAELHGLPPPDQEEDQLQLGA